MTTSEQDTQLSVALLEALQAALRTHAGPPPHSATARAWLLRDALGSAPVLESLLRWADGQHEAGALQESQWRTLHDLLHELLEDATVNTAPGGLAAAAVSPPPPAAAAPPRIRKAAVPEVSTTQGLLTESVIERRAPSRSELRSEPARLPGPAAGAGPERGRTSSLTEAAAKLARTGAGDAVTNTGAPQSITTRTVGPSPAPSMIEGRYQLLKEVHRGTRSSIWQASVTDGAAHTGPGRSRTFVAVRLTPVELQVSDADADADFERLSRVSAHPALLTLLSQGREGDWAYQVQAWIEGQTLEARLRENLSSLDAGLELPAWIRQLAGALETLHEADFVHGDVKPANVIIRPDGRACLVDLDVVRRGSVTGERRALTPAFASPEALAGAPADPRDDVYSLAVLAFRVLSGYLPYGRSGSLSDGHPLPPPIRPQGLDDSQWHALRQALEPVRELRTATPTALADALWPAAAAPASAPWVISKRSARSRPSRSRRGSRVAMGAAALAAVAVGAAMLAQPDGVTVPSWMPDVASLLRTGDQQQVTRGTGDPPGEGATAGDAADMTTPPAPSADVMTGAAEEALATLPGSTPEPVVERDDAGMTEAEVYVPPMAAEMLEQATAATGAQAPPDTGTDPTPAQAGTVAPSPTPPAPAAAASPPAQAARQTYSFPASRIQFGGMAPAALVPVRRQGSLEQRAEIRFAIDPGSARPDEDFMPPPNNIAVFEPGEAETLIIVPLIRSIEQRTTRSFWIQLRTPGNLTGEFPEIQVVLPPVD
jgi:serine/threonine protein kinase